MPNNTPTLDEWRGLHAVAEQVKKLAPWEFMYEDDVFGVRDPETREIGFISVMGAGGEHFAVAVYPGAHALYDFLELHESHESGDPDVLADRVLEIPQLQASFEDRDLLDKQDREILKKLGLKYRGKNAWLKFRGYEPGMFPWYLTSAEARFLARVLDQLLDVAPRFRDDEDLLFPEGEDEFLVRTSREENGRLVWEDSIVEVSQPPKKRILPAPIKSETLSALKQLPKSHREIEMDSSMFPAPIREKQNRPFFPYLMMIVDEESGLILGNDLMEPLPSLDKMREQIPQRLAEKLLLFGVVPRAIFVRSEWLADLLKPLADDLGIRIKHSPSLPMLDEVMKYMASMLR